MRHASLNPRCARVFFCSGLLALAGVAGATAGTGLAASSTASTAVPPAASAPAPSGAGLQFDRVFFSRGEPAAVHYRARYTAGGQPHETEAWRDHEARFARRTDGRIATYLAKPARDGEWHMVVLDLPRHLRTDIDRTNLLRIGHFTDWFSLTHALQRPSGAYLLVDDVTPAGHAAIQPVATCHWYRLQQGATTHRICWSSKTRLPLLITDAQGKVEWQVTEVDTRSIAPAVFQINDAGFVRNNANEDIQAD